jgi:SAM-dependent methyltransferase
LITADLDRLDLRPGRRILDAGCGSGRHLAGLCRYPGIRAIGVDRSGSDLVAARERLEIHERLGECGGSPWGVAAADVGRLPFSDGAFDGVICSEVLEHVPDHGRAAAELIRVLRAGGRLVVSVPRRWPERICWALSAAYRTADGGHLRIYRRRDVLDLFCGRGARLDRIHHAHALHSPFWWLKCAVGLERAESRLVDLYHRFLVWDLMAKPRSTRRLEALLDPFLGKSTVFYFTKTDA